MSAREFPKDAGQRAIAERAQSIAASGRREVTWKLNVEHKLKPPVRFYETKPHPTKASALKRGTCNLSGMRVGACVCSLLRERMASASRLQRSTTGASARPRTSRPTKNRWIPVLPAECQVPLRIARMRRERPDQSASYFLHGNVSSIPRICVAMRLAGQSSRN